MLSVKFSLNTTPPPEISKVIAFSFTILELISLRLSHTQTHAPLTNQEHMMPHASSPAQSHLSVCVSR